MDAMLRPSRGSSQALTLTFLTLLLGACIQVPLTGSGYATRTSVPLPTARFGTMDAAANSAVQTIEARNARRVRGHFEPVEWSFNVCRDGEGFYPCSYHTDNRWNEVRVTILRDSVASGHTHTPAWCGPVQRCRKGQSSQHDEGPEGILRAMQSAGRLLPHYLRTESGQVFVWEWSAEREGWVERAVPSVPSAPATTLARSSFR
jgi:hypothetical protein